MLAWDPKIVILDEPTIGQDYRQKERLRQFILQLRRQGKTIIIVTHDVEFVAECSPSIILMREGRIVAMGEAKEILTNEILVNQASVALPEITKIFKGLEDLGFPSKVIDVYEAADILYKRLGEQT